MQISGVILAGGKSRRMGQNKALLAFGEELIIERIIAKIKLIIVDANRMMIVAGAKSTDIQEYIKFNIPIVSDLFPNQGPLGGVYTALVASKTEYNLFVGCDMPFLSVPFLKYMISQSQGYDLTLPKFSSKYQPLCSVYSKNCLPKIKTLIEAGKLKMESLVSEFKAKIIEEKEIKIYDPDGLTFFNVNTQLEYQKALEIAEKELKELKELRG